MKTQVKLTLRMDEALVKRAKQLATKRGTSVSRMVADYFTFINQWTNSDPKPEDLPPLTRSLWGAAAGADFTEEDYIDYLVEKHR